MNLNLQSEFCSIVANTKGGELNSIKFNDKEYLWNGDMDFWKGHAPVCFPINGAIRNNEAIAFGKKCAMPRHGVARNQEFQVVENTSSSVTFKLIANGETILQYPFNFELFITYTLEGKTITTQYTVVNHGGCKMPFAIGGHPAFNCPLDEDEDFTDYYIEFDKSQTLCCLRPDLKTGLINNDVRETVLENSNTLDLFHYLFTKDAMIFDDIKSKKVSLKSRKTGRGLAMEFEDFPNLLLWSSVGKTPFIALEPWTGLSTCIDESDILEEKRGIIVLDSLESASFQFKITLF